MVLFSYLRLIIVYINLIVYSQTLMKRLQPFVLIIIEIVLELNTPVVCVFILVEFFIGTEGV